MSCGGRVTRPEVVAVGLGTKGRKATVSQFSSFDGLEPSQLFGRASDCRLDVLQLEAPRLIVGCHRLFSLRRNRTRSPAYFGRVCPSWPASRRRAPREAGAIAIRSAGGYRPII